MPPSMCPRLAESTLADMIISLLILLKKMRATLCVAKWGSWFLRSLCTLHLRIPQQSCPTATALAMIYKYPIGSCFFVYLRRIGDILEGVRVQHTSSQDTSVFDPATRGGAMALPRLNEIQVRARYTCRKKPCLLLFREYFIFASAF